jgi:hypothetical protein
MFLPKLQNLRTFVRQHLLALEQPQELATKVSRIGTRPSISAVKAEATAFGRWDDRPRWDPVLQAMAELGSDWTAPKLALRAEVQLAAADRRVERFR